MHHPQSTVQDIYNNVMDSNSSKAMTSSSHTATYLVDSSRPLPSKSDEELSLWSTSRQIHLYPVLVIYSIYMLMGVVGNSTVCYVCSTRMPRTALNYYVLSLAIAELVGCVLIIPIEITKNMNAYSFNYPILCKMEKYLRSIVIFFTCFVLIALAFGRCKRIVKPHTRHVTMTHFRFIIIGSLIFALVVSIPETILAGIQSIQTEFGDAIVCSTFASDQYVNTTFTLLWACFIILVYMISIIVISTIYCVISATIWKRDKLQTDHRSRPPVISDLTQRVKYRWHSDLLSTNHYHHNSLPSPKRQARMSLENHELFELSLVSRNSTGRALLKQTKESKYASQVNLNDARKLQIEVHHHRSLDNCQQNETSNCDEAGTPPPSSSWFPTNTEASKFMFENIHFGTPNPSQREVHQLESGHLAAQSPASVSSVKGDCTDYLHGQPTLHCTGAVSENDLASCLLPNQASDTDYTIATHKPTPQDLSHRGLFTTHDLDLDRDYIQQPQQRNDKQQQRHELGPDDPHQHKEQTEDFEHCTVPRRKNGRRFATPVFLDEVCQTINRRRRQKAMEWSQFFGRKESTDGDIFSSPTLSPMGSLRTRSALRYSRKRSTFIMFVMTLTTAISLLPQIIVLIYSLVHPDSEVHLSPDELILFHVASNSYFISLAGHSYIYGFWNKRFMKALRSLFEGFRRKTKKRRSSSSNDGLDDDYS